MRLFFREFKKVVFSLPYFILVAALYLFAVSQDVLPACDPITQPQPGLESYGSKRTDDPSVIMPAAMRNLTVEFGVNSYTTYPVGFYKCVRLNDSQQARVAEILTELSGRTPEEVYKIAGAARSGIEALILSGENLIPDGEGGFMVETEPEVPVPDSSAEEFLLPRADLEYESFKAAMAEVDRILGGGSSYAGTYLAGFGAVPKTYEDACADYAAVRDADRFTGAYARIFCDYLGIMLSILPVFLSTALFLRDRAAKMHPLIMSRRISSARLILTRYAALAVSVLLPVLLMIYWSNASMWGFHAGERLDYLAPLKYALGWLTPSILISCAVGMLFTLLTDTPVAIAVQGLWWFVDLGFGMQAGLSSGYSWYLLSPRHNSYQHGGFSAGLPSLILNRALFTAAALALAALSIAVYELKRKGRLNLYDSIAAKRTNRKSKPAA